MNISTEEHIIRNVVLAVDGRFDAFHIDTFQQHAKALIDDLVVHFVVDLTHVDFLDSAAIAALVTLLKKARKGGGDVKLVWPVHKDAQRIIRLTKFDTVFAMFDSAEAALEH